jgi:hypothetical protein
MVEPKKEQKETKTEPKEEISSPQISGFKIQGTLVKGFDSLKSQLSKVSAISIAEEEDYVAALNIESRDIRKNPYLFSIIYFRDREIEMVFSIIPEISPKKRKIDMLKYFLNILTLAESAYEIDHKQFYQLIQTYLKEITEYATSAYEEIYSKYDILHNEFVNLKKRNAELNDRLAKLSKEAIDLKARNDELQVRLKQLESPSDETLKLKIQEWLEVHHNEINISEFAKTYKILESRVEQLLNAMVMQGYLESLD